MALFEEDPKKAEWLVRRLGAGSNVVGPAVYVGIVVLFECGVWQLPQFGLSMAVKLYLLGGLLAAALALAMPIGFLKGRLAKELRKGGRGKTLRRVQRNYLIIFALAETASLLGLVYYLFSGEFYYFLAFPALTLAYYFGVKPEAGSISRGKRMG